MNGTDSGETAVLERQIAEWRRYLRRRKAIGGADIEELEDHLREEVAVLVESGLSSEEAFLVTIRRMGAQDALSREFAREHSERLWKQLVVAGTEEGAAGLSGWTERLVVLGLAVVAALGIKVPALFGVSIGTDSEFYARNFSFFVLPLLTGYFFWRRGLGWGAAWKLGLGFLVAGVFANLPMAQGMEVLTALHLPILLWLLVGIAYAGGRWNEVQGRMDFIRFTGELLIYYVLIGLGGGVLIGFMALLFEAIGIDIEPLLENWLLPCGMVGAVIIASWLVEAKQSVVENMAPVLTYLFTPLFALVLVTFLGLLAWTGRGMDIERDMLIAFDLLLVVVLGLLVYAVSARDPMRGPGLFDWAQVVLLVSALLVDAVALWAIAGRITEYGFTPNRVAALGENLILLVNLGWSAVLYLRFMAGRGPFSALERWQTGYIPVYAVWSGIVVAVFPVVFG